MQTPAGVRYFDGCLRRCGSVEGVANVPRLGNQPPTMTHKYGTRIEPAFGNRFLDNGYGDKTINPDY
jgi:hypothetical protein